MDELCRSPFWQSNLTWNIASQPDLTSCFQETVLIWVPCLLLWLLAPIDIISIYKTQGRYIPVTLLNLFKTFLSTVLCLLSVIEFIEALTRTEPDIPLVDFITPIVKSLTFVLVFSMHVLHRNRGVHTSGVLLVFWLSITIASIINVRSLIISTLHGNTQGVSVADWHLSEFRFTLRLVASPIIWIQFILACIADKKAQDPFMQPGEDYRSRSPENDASILSRMTFWWLNSLMWLGYKRALVQDDLFAVRHCDKTEMITSKFDHLLQVDINNALEARRVSTFSPGLDSAANKLLKQRGTSERRSWIPLVSKRQGRTAASESHTQSRQEAKQKEEEEEETARFVGVTRTIIKTFWPQLLLASFFKLVASLLTFASPLLLSCIISFVSSDEPAWRGYLYASMIFFLSLFESLSTNQEQYITSLNVMRIRTCLTSALYRKTLKLSNQGRVAYTTGQIVNFMAVDSQRVADLVQTVNNIWSAPIQLVISMTLLYQQLGIAILAGIGVMVVNIPLNGKVAMVLRSLQQQVMQFKDKRIKLLSEMISGIKIIKIHAWEEPFKKRCEAIRNDEIKSLTKQAWYSACITFAFTCLPFLVALASFATYVLIDDNNILDAQRIFVSLSLFNIIRVPLAILPMLITNLSMFVVAVKRINKFLESDEVDPDAIKQIDDDSYAIKIKNGNFKWEQKGDVILEDVNCEIPKRKLVAVVGPVGSGKSSLISAMLGSMEKCDGEVMVDLNSSLSYVPQEAWILNTTLKNNILFSKVLNEDRYTRILDACALVPDLKTLEMGDQSEIGEKGLNLSGGQKQRVSLARAVYADTDIYILDDPMNAVDAHVGRHIFDNVIGPKGMLRDRTRVLITNKLSVLPEVDHILVMKDGQVSESGSYEQLLKNRGLFSQLLVKYLLENSDNATTLSESARGELITKELKRLEELQTRKSRENTPEHQGRANKKPTDTSASETPATATKSSSAGKYAAPPHGAGTNLTGQEVSQVGSVGLEVHMNFIKTMGMNFVLAMAVHILSSGFTISSNIWLSDWSNDSLNATLRNNTSQRFQRLGVYAGLGVGESICVISSTILLNIACLRGSQLLHNGMLSRIMRAPMSWFNSTPSGRIINRFSKDIDTVDVTIRFNVRLLTVIALRSVTSLILISIFYVSTSRQLKRIESTTKSPIYQHFSETITGTSSIRAFKANHQFILESNHRVDVNNASYYIGFVASRWLAIRLEFLGFIVVLTASLIAVLSRGSISPGIAGLSVTYSLTVTTVLSFLVRTYSDYETNVVSVERLLEYTRTPVEPDDEDEPSDPNWPARGEIIFDKFSARYRPELDYVLRQFSLKIEPEEKVGLVGRTGAGKSSVTLALFRVLEADQGCIVIDGVDISHINLKVLRSKLTVIPQDPILFTGSIRQNVDPTETYSDEQIWRALELAHLGGFLRGLPSGLDHEVAEGGSNFSVGQKQLFCLARTLLRRSKILILDEATAAVDVETDSLIQRTIREEFKDCTIITVAHRLETIQDYSRLVVMEDGVAVEQGSPAELSRRQGSRYLSLAQAESGGASSSSSAAAAAAAAEIRKR